MLISEFLLSRQQPISIPDGYNEFALAEETSLFNAWINEFPEDTHDEITERLQYIRYYALQFPSFDGEELYPSSVALTYYENRLARIKASGLSETEFYKFEMLQDAIADLSLSPKATFDFIVFIWSQLFYWMKKGSVRTIENRLKSFCKLIKDNPHDKLKINISVGSRHFESTNDIFIKAIIQTFLDSKCEAANICEEVRPKVGEIDYILVRTLLTYLPIKHKKEKKGTFTQSERTFSLCVLWLNKYFAHYDDDDPIDKCIDNNQTFDKMMRDFKDTRIPLIVPPFLYSFGRWR